MIAMIFFALTVLFLFLFFILHSITFLYIYIEFNTLNTLCSGLLEYINDNTNRGVRINNNNNNNNVSL